LISVLLVRYVAVCTCRGTTEGGAGVGTGVAVGATIGTGVGATVGTGVGAIVGTGVGVGARVGTGLGVESGAAVGDTPGSGVGVGVAPGLGETSGTGDAVGAGVAAVAPVTDEANTAAELAPAPATVTCWPTETVPDNDVADTIPIGIAGPDAGVSWKP
jgi:hypothetical protein